MSKLEQPDASYSRKEQMVKVIETVGSLNLMIAVIYNTDDKPLAVGVVTELNKILSGSRALVFECVTKDNKWFSNLRRTIATHYIFIGLPPQDVTVAESKFFDPNSPMMTKVVVVSRNRWQQGPSAEGHYLDKFQHVEGSKKDLAAMALYHFAGTVQCKGTRCVATYSILQEISLCRLCCSRLILST